MSKKPPVDFKAVMASMERLRLAALLHPELVASNTDSESAWQEVLKNMERKDEEDRKTEKD